MAKLSKRQKRAYDDIVALKDERRKNVRKMAAAGVLIVVLVGGKALMDWFGVLPQASSYISMAIWAIAIVLAFFFAGPASINLTKSKNAIAEMYARYGITEADVAAYERGELE